MNLTDAQLYCSDENGKLVVFEDERKYTKVMDYAEKHMTADYGRGWTYFNIWTNMTYDVSSKI